MEFQEKLDKIWTRISDDDFLANRGVANEVRYYVFDYEPCYELIMRQKIESLKKQNNPEADGFEIVEYDLYKMVIGILEERGYLDKCIKFEETKGREYLYNAVSKLLRLTNDDNLIVNKIVAETPEHAVVFLTGVGKVFPFVRSHNVLNNLHQILDRVPVVMFYPGNWNGQTLSLFGTINDGNYYRAFTLIVYEDYKTMIIRDMFFKEIDRDIKGVIKVGQSDDENIYQELDEYVVTSELEKYMDRFFAAYKRGVESHTDKMGVWISGFFGSGKSHFLKILSYILSNKVVTDDKGQTHSASSFFLDGVKVENASLKKKIEEVSSWSDDVDVILFNIDSKSATDSKMNKDAIKDVFMKVFNDYLGYCGSIPFLADFERKLDNDGRYEEFKAKFEEINGSSWVESREDFYFIQDEIIEAVVSLGIMSENEARNWTENAQNSYSLSIDKFAEYIRKYCESKGKDHHILFLVDEIGQYIADDSKLMLNLQTVTEDLGTACRGNAWIIVTSQQDIDSITKTMGEDFSKIQGRFDTRIALSSANVDEVIRKRILFKKDSATVILKDLYDSHEFDIKGNITFSEGTPEMPLYADADEFAEVYPFIPYQFKLLGSVLTSVRQYSSSGKHLADGERSMLALFKEAAQKYENEREGVLVPFNAFYSALDDFIDHTHRIVITQAARNTRLNNFDVELLKVLFMIKHVNNFSKNLENITTLMISNINEDRLALGKKVEASLRVLCDELLVQKNGNEYIFLTNEEQEAEDAIRKINIDPTETVNYVAQVAFEEIIVMTNNKYRHNNRYQFSFNQKIDNRQYKSNQLSGITLHLLTAYSGEVDDLALSLKAATEKSVIVRLSDDYAYLSETEEMKKIESFLQRPDLTSLNDYEIISATKRKERNDKAKRIKDYIRMALETADIYVCDGKITTKSKDVTARINEAFAKLIASEYSKLKDMTSEPTQADILDVLKKNKTQELQWP